MEISAEKGSREYQNQKYLLALQQGMLIHQAMRIYLRIDPDELCRLWELGTDKLIFGSATYKDIFDEGTDIIFRCIDTYNSKSENTSFEDFAITHLAQLKEFRHEQAMIPMPKDIRKYILRFQNILKEELKASDTRNIDIAIRVCRSEYAKSVLINTSAKKIKEKCDELEFILRDWASGNYNVVSFDGEISEHQQHSFNYAKSKSDTPDEYVQRLELISGLCCADILKKNQKQIVCMIYGLTTNGIPMARTEISRILNLTLSTISTSLNNGIIKLNNHESDPRLRRFKEYY